jgi:hypothetical protein
MHTAPQHPTAGMPTVVIRCAPPSWMASYGVYRRDLLLCCALQVRKEALTTLSVLTSSLQCFEQQGSNGQQGLSLVRSPALEVLITRRAATMKVGDTPQAAPSPVWRCTKCLPSACITVQHASTSSTCSAAQEASTTATLHNQMRSGTNASMVTTAACKAQATGEGTWTQQLCPLATSQVLNDVKYDKIPAVRTAAAKALSEMAAIPGPEGEQAEEQQPKSARKLRPSEITGSTPGRAQQAGGAAEASARRAGSARRPGRTPRTPRTPRSPGMAASNGRMGMSPGSRRYVLPAMVRLAIFCDSSFLDCNCLQAVACCTLQYRQDSASNLVQLYPHLLLTLASCSRQARARACPIALTCCTTASPVFSDNA